MYMKFDLFSSLDYIDYSSYSGQLIDLYHNGIGCIFHESYISWTLYRIDNSTDNSKIAPIMFILPL